MSDNPYAAAYYIQVTYKSGDRSFISNGAISAIATFNKKEIGDILQQLRENNPEKVFTAVSII